MEKKTKKKGLSLKLARVLTAGYFIVIVATFSVGTDETINLFGFLASGWLVWGAAFAIAIVTEITAKTLLKCENCGQAIPALNIAFAGQRFKFCPYCGAEIEVK